MALAGRAGIASTHKGAVLSATCVTVVMVTRTAGRGTEEGNVWLTRNWTEVAKTKSCGATVVAAAEKDRCTIELHGPCRRERSRIIANKSEVAKETDFATTRPRADI
jgi:hypothetical protein